jgi:polar amino acid transport system substrate-binding protein
MVIRDSGYTSNHLIYPYARIIHELKSGKTDLSILFKYKELEDFVIYLAPLPSLKNVVIGLKDFEINDIKSLEGKRLGYLRGAKFSDEIDNNPNIIKYETDNFSQSIGMLKLGRVDGVIGPLEPIYKAGKEYGLNVDSFGKAFVVSTRTPWIQLSKNSKSKLSVSKVVESFKKAMLKGELQTLYDKYTSNQFECDSTDK